KLGCSARLYYTTITELLVMPDETQTLNRIVDLSVLLHKFLIAELIPLYKKRKSILSIFVVLLFGLISCNSGPSCRRHVLGIFQRQEIVFIKPIFCSRLTYVDVS